MRLSRTASIVALLVPSIFAELENSGKPVTTPPPKLQVEAAAQASRPREIADAGVDVVLNNILSGISQDGKDLEQIVSAYAAVITQHTESKAAPTRIEQVTSIVKSIFEPGPTDILAPAANLILNSASPINKKAIEGQVLGSTNSFDNRNDRAPDVSIYPRRGAKDASYSVSEQDLRKAIFFPPGFTYGKKTPVLMIPGTGTTGGDNFAGNLIPLLNDKDYADLVWLNVPGYQLHDAQVNAEYVAYAISYVSTVSKNEQIAVISWSQGGINVQWALKYWSSLRKVVKNFIAISPDYHGTVQAHFLCPGFPTLACNPSVLQQDINSLFIKTLLSDGGDSSYVPTTNIYSSFFDEIVQPQTGKSASAFLKDSRSAGVTNNEVQAICPGSVAGSFVTHEGVLYNPLTFHLIQDALLHGGPGQISRLNLRKICNQYASDGLSLVDILDTEAVIPQAALNILFVQPHILREPPLKAYARRISRSH